MSVEELKDWIDQKFIENKEDHNSIKSQVEKTNGRVRSLEKWRWGVGGAMAVIVFIITLIGGTVLAYFK